MSVVPANPDHSDAAVLKPAAPELSGWILEV